MQFIIYTLTFNGHISLKPHYGDIVESRQNFIDYKGLTIINSGFQKSSTKVYSIGMATSVVFNHLGPFNKSSLYGDSSKNSSAFFLFCLSRL